MASFSHEEVAVTRRRLFNISESLRTKAEEMFIEWTVGGRQLTAQERDWLAFIETMSERNSWLWSECAQLEEKFANE
ncbi:hypothetical protein [Martelella sp. AMO21009]